MNQHLVRCFGLSHKTAPIQLRERLRCTLSDLLQRRLQSHSEFQGIRELAWLQTCNRVELYVRVESETVESEKAMRLLVGRATGVDMATLRGHSYYKEGEGAVRHLCRVAAGLESALLGEHQILGQVVDCLEESKRKQCVEAAGLGGAFKTAIEAGRKARAQTAINRRPASLGSAAIDWARTRLGRLEDKRIVVVGLGEMGTLTVKALRARRFSNLEVLNRTVSRAHSVARQYGCGWLPFEALPESLVNADLVILSTSAPSPVVSRDAVRSALARRHGRPLVLVDLGVPRNVESGAGRLEGVFLCDSDRLHRQLTGALQARRREIPRVEAIIDGEMERIGQAAGPSREPSCLLDLRRTVEDIRQSELDRLFRHLGPVDAGTDDHIRRFSQALVNKILHEPTVRIKKASHTQAHAYEGSVRELFGLCAEQETGVT